MARIRSTHPEQWVDERFVTCSPLARLLAIAVRNFADDNGIFSWNPIKMKMLCLPADNCEMDELLDELLESGQIKRYEVDGKSHGIIRNFTRFQNPRKATGYHTLPTEPMGNEYVTPHHVKDRKYRSSTKPVTNRSRKKAPEGEEGRGEERRDSETDITVGEDSTGIENNITDSAAKKKRAAGKKYAFEGKVVRLTEKDFKDWENSFKHIRDLFGVLKSRDEFLATLPESDRKNWFMSTASYLANRNEKAARDADEPPGFHM